MSRRDRDEDKPPPGREVDQGDIIPGTVLPSDAEDLKLVIDRRFKALLSLTVSPKELTAALEAATDWWKVSREGEGQEEWGKHLGRTTRNE